MGKKVVWYCQIVDEWMMVFSTLGCPPPPPPPANNSLMIYPIEWNEEGTACKQVPAEIINSRNLHQFENRFDKFIGARPNKNISVLLVTGLKILGRLGTHYYSFFQQK